MAARHRFRPRLVTGRTTAALRGRGGVALVSAAIAAAAAEWARAARPPNCLAPPEATGQDHDLPPAPMARGAKAETWTRLGRHRPVASIRGRGAPP